MLAEPVREEDPYNMEYNLKNVPKFYQIKKFRFTSNETERIMVLFY